MLPLRYPPTRPQPRDLIMTACLVVLLIILGWSTVSNYLQSRTYPELASGIKALKANRTEEAATLFERAISARPDDPTLYFQILQACQEKKQWNLCIRFASRGLADCKNARRDIRANLNLALAGAYQEGRPAGWQSDALMAGQRAWELDPQNPVMLNLYGYLLADVGRKEDWGRAQEMITHALRVLREQPMTPENQTQYAVTEDSYGWVLYRQGNYPGAVDALAQTLDDLPSGALDGDGLKVIYYHLGAAYRKAGDPERARYALQTALCYDPKYPDAHAELDELATIPPHDPPLVSPPAPTTEKPSGPASPNAASLKHGAPAPSTGTPSPAFTPLNDKVSLH